MTVVVPMKLTGEAPIVSDLIFLDLWKPSISFEASPSSTQPHSSCMHSSQKLESLFELWPSLQRDRAYALEVVAIRVA